MRIFYPAPHGSGGHLGARFLSAGFSASELGRQLRSGNKDSVWLRDIEGEGRTLPLRQGAANSLPVRNLRHGLFCPALLPFQP